MLINLTTNKFAGN